MRVNNATDINAMISGISSQAKVYCFGSGNMGKDICDYARDSGLDLNRLFFVDNNSDKHGKFIDLYTKKIKIISKEGMIETINQDDVILIATLACKEIYDDLLNYSKLENISVFFSQLLYLNRVNENSVVEFDKNIDDVIPKKIHYFWFGKGEISKQHKDYIAGWAEICPEYEIVRWDENNYDITKNQYMYQAYKAKRWGFVPDYARLDVIYNYGGIYLDTDVELHKSLDCLLKYKAFFSYNASLKVNAGNGFGAMPKHELIKEMRDYYDDFRFVEENGKLNDTLCTEYQYGVLRKHGMKIKGEFCEIGNGVVLPFDIMCGYNHYFNEYVHSDRAIMRHHYKRSWHDEKLRNRSKESVEFLKKIRDSKNI